MIFLCGWRTTSISSAQLIIVQVLSSLHPLLMGHFLLSSSTLMQVGINKEKIT